MIQPALKATTSAAFLLLAAPALAQSQGGTGVGVALDQAQAGLAEVQRLFDEQWEGETGRWVKGGLGAAGVAAALLSASDALVRESGQGTIRVDNGEFRLRFGESSEALDGGTAPTSGTTGTTGTR